MEMELMPRCPSRVRTGRACWYPAGYGTGHLGFGTCSRHGGSWPQSEEIWRKAMDIANREDVSPAEALIGLVRGAMGRAAYVDGVLSELMRKHVVDGGDPLVPPPSVHAWLKESRNERNLAARTAKAAVDAGVMAALARRMDMEGTLVADALTAALDVLALDPDERMRALGAAQERLMLAE